MKEKMYSLLFRILVTMLFISNLSATLPPAYLKELDIKVKKATKDETLKAFRQLSKKTVIAIRSLSNGGYVYVKNEKDEKIVTTIRIEEFANFLAFTSTTPLETQFIATKITGNIAILSLKSKFMEGLMLSICPDSLDVTFQKFNKNDKSQQWELSCADGLNQVYIKNRKTGKLLGLDEDGKVICQSSSASKMELFKIVVLDQN